MFRCLLHLFLICQLLVFKNVEALIGENILQADPHEFPFIASLGVKLSNNLIERGHICTGVLITKRHVLTAAHCLEKEVPSEIDVIIGDVDLRTASVKYKVDAWVTYDNWARILGKPIKLPINDIAIVKLSSTVDRPDTKPVCITDLNNQQLHRTKAVITGWGITNQQKLADVLQKARVMILTPEQCRRELKLITNVPIAVRENYLCSSADPYALTACGDSGGPLLDKNYNLLGIIRSTCPNETHQWGQFSPEFINHYKVNLHPSVDYYREFIENVTNIATRPKTC